MVCLQLEQLLTRFRAKCHWLIYLREGVSVMKMSDEYDILVIFFVIQTRSVFFCMASKVEMRIFNQVGGGRRAEGEEYTERVFADGVWAEP